MESGARHARLIAPPRPGRPGFRLAIGKRFERRTVDVPRRSDDGGQTWRAVNASEGIGGRPFYYADLRVDPQNPDRVYSLHSTITVSIDGGASFETLASYGRIHPEHHAMWIDPADPRFIIDGNDGGLAVSHDHGETWRVLENLPLAQYYHINVDNAFPYHVYGGMQDNGSWRGPNRVYRGGGVRNVDWETGGFGDGFDVVPDPDNPRYGYAMWQGGYLMRYDAETGGFEYIRPQPDSVLNPTEKQLRFNWNAAVAQSPHDPNTVYYGSQHVHKSTNEGNAWTAISPDLTTDRDAWQNQLNSGGLTYDVTEAENFTTIFDIAPSPVQEGVIWAGTDDGQLHVTRHGGQTWTNVVDNIEGVPEHTWIHQVKASKVDAAEAFVVFDNHRRADWTPYVYHTTDYGQSWTRIVGPDDVDGYALSIVQDPVARDLLFLGTQLGLYYSLDGRHGPPQGPGDDRLARRAHARDPSQELRRHPRRSDARECASRAGRLLPRHGGRGADGNRAHRPRTGRAAPAPRARQGQRLFRGRLARIQAGRREGRPVVLRGLRPDPDGRATGSFRKEHARPVGAQPDGLRFLRSRFPVPALHGGPSPTGPPS